MNFKLSTLKPSKFRRASSSAVDIGSELQNGPFDRFTQIHRKQPTTSDAIINADLIYLILEQAYFNDSMRPNFHHLTRYALVARAWRRPAQALLYHEVSIKDETAYRCLQRIFNDTSEYAKWLLGCVRVLNYWIYAGGSHKPATWEARLAPTLKACPQIYELRLGVDALAKLQVKTITELNETSPPLRALQIAMRSDESGRSAIGSDLPLQLITAVTAWKLEFLVMRGDQFAAHMCTTYPEVPHQLTEFRWTIAGGVGNPPDPFVTWVTKNSLKSLEIVHMPQTHAIVGQIGTNLRSLRVPDATTLPNNLLGLKELILTTAVASVPTDVVYYTRLPPNIVHLGISVTSSITGVASTTLISQLKHKLPAKLRTLSIYAESNSRNPNTTYARYSHQFAAKQILKIPGEEVVIRIFSGFENCQVAMRSDLVRSLHYPREVTIENMRYMSRVVANNEEKERKQRSKHGFTAFMSKLG